jgi:hypothetical protein
MRYRFETTGGVETSNGINPCMEIYTSVYFRIPLKTLKVAQFGSQHLRLEDIVQVASKMADLRVTIASPCP